MNNEILNSVIVYSTVQTSGGHLPGQEPRPVLDLPNWGGVRGLQRVPPGAGKMEQRLRKNREIQRMANVHGPG